MQFTAMNKADLKNLVGFARDYHLQKMAVSTVLTSMEIEKYNYDGMYNPQTILNNKLKALSGAEYIDHCLSGQVALLVNDYEFEAYGWVPVDVDCLDVISSDEYQCMLAEMQDNVEAWCQYLSELSNETYEC